MGGTMDGRQSHMADRLNVSMLNGDRFRIHILLQGCAYSSRHVRPCPFRRLGQAIAHSLVH